MRNFIYRCPTTGLNVQGSVADEDRRGHGYVAQTCLACSGIHVVDPATGKLPPERTATEPPERAAKPARHPVGLRKTP